MEQYKKLQTKDLIIGGAYAALYVVIMMAAVTLLAITPVTFLMTPFITGIILGTVFMLYCMKIPKRGAILILGIIISLVLVGSTGWIAPVWGLFCTIIAELLAAAGKYRSGKWFRASFCAFACTLAGPFWMLVIGKQAVLESCRQYYGDEYVTKIDAITPSWIMVVIILGGVIGGLIGGLFGQKLLKKHFKKAGII